MAVSENPQESTYPGVHLAYPLAVTAYDVALRRLDAMDNRLQTIMAFIVATSAAVPALIAGRGASFWSPYFYIASGCFGLAIILGTIARLAGSIRVLVPRKAFNHWLHKSDWEFKMDFINQAANDFEHNNTWIIRKWWGSVAVTVLFFAQSVFLLLWVLDSF